MVEKTSKYYSDENMALAKPTFFKEFKTNLNRKSMKPEVMVCDMNHDTWWLSLLINYYFILGAKRAFFFFENYRCKTGNTYSWEFFVDAVLMDKILIVESEPFVVDFALAFCNSL